MSKGNDRTIYRRASDQKWIDKRNDASRGFAFDTQGSDAGGGRILR